MSPHFAPGMALGRCPPPRCVTNALGIAVISAVSAGGELRPSVTTVLIGEFSHDAKLAVHPPFKRSTPLVMGGEQCFASL